MVKCDNCSGAGTNSGKKYKCMVSDLPVGHPQLPAVSRLCVAQVSRANLPMLVGPTFVARSYLPIYLCMWAQQQFSCRFVVIKTLRHKVHNSDPCAI